MLLLLLLLLALLVIHLLLLALSLLPVAVPLCSAGLLYWVLLQTLAKSESRAGPWSHRPLPTPDEHGAAAAGLNAKTSTEPPSIGASS